ncbi:VOC family protein [Microcoleus sp. BROC3]|uniref:VOC family protein n=1 Tax=Microcoleus sp. BROC3 TaxID=3055323 RepID=UPI002FD66D43
MSDLGFTHIALSVSDVDKSISFYAKYAGFKVVHRRVDPITSLDVAWICDLIQPFVIVLIKARLVNGKLLPDSHLGVACESREKVDQLCREAESEGLLLNGPTDSEPPVGYWAYIRDPDGHTLEIAYGQEVSALLEKLLAQPKL